MAIPTGASHTSLGTVQGQVRPLVWVQLMVEQCCGKVKNEQPVASFDQALAVPQM